METVTMMRHTLERAGGRVVYWLAGPVGRPLVICTHGATMDHRMFDAQVPVLAPHYRVLTWDVRGHGQSRPAGEKFSIRLAVEDLRAIMDEQGYNEAVFVGQSMGGIIAQEMVFLYPKRVTALVMIGSECNTLRFSFYDFWSMSITTAVIHLYPALLLKPLLAHFAATRLDVQAYAYHASFAMSQADFLATWEALLTCLHYEPGYRITRPLLLTHGEFDNWGNIRRIAPIWAARDPYSRYVVIPRAGHNANQDNPDFFNDLMLTFLHEHVPVKFDHS